MSTTTGSRLIKMTPEFLAEMDRTAPGRHRPERVTTKRISPEQRAAARLTPEESLVAVVASAPVPEPVPEPASVPVPGVQRPWKLAMLKANLRGRFRW
jgi:predicted component of type VI protein secretion system